MKTHSLILIGTAVALAFGLTQQALTRGATQLEPARAAPGLSASTATFHAPKVEGVNLDVRLMGHMRASPVQTAERFCRDNGYSMVADLTIRPSTATRTIADGEVHAGPGATNQAFAMIRCETHPA
jgi:hypothetical protein